MSENLIGVGVMILICICWFGISICRYKIGYNRGYQKAKEELRTK